MRAYRSFEMKEVDQDHFEDVSDVDGHRRRTEDERGVDGLGKLM